MPIRAASRMAPPGRLASMATAGTVNPMASKITDSPRSRTRNPRGNLLPIDKLRVFFDRIGASAAHRIVGWAKSGEVKNADLWKALDAAVSRHQVHWRWLKGHAGHPENERCDELASAEITRRKAGA